ncbi:hypothetical protein IKS57_02105 [bacterium]|nr:hypothetical protein [bacterium]
MDQVEERLNKVEARLDKIEKRLDILEKKVEDIMTCPTIKKELKLLN